MFEPVIYQLPFRESRQVIGVFPDYAQDPLGHEVVDERLGGFLDRQDGRGDGMPSAPGLS